MKVMFKNPVTAEKHEITVALSVPCATVTVAVENIIDTFPAEVQAEHGRTLLALVNKAMKHNAVSSVVYAENLFAALANRVTYGKYTIKPGENGTGYALGNTSTVDKEVKIFNAKEKKTEKVRRVAFVTYADCVQFVKALNTENKKNNAPLFSMPGDFTPAEMRKIRYFIKCANGRLDEKDRENLIARGEEYSAFLEDKDSANGKKARVQIFYDIFNRHTGRNIRGIHHVENNVVKAMTSYDTMYKVDKDSAETAYISALFNEWLNSELVTATAYRAKNPESVGKKKKKNKDESKPVEVAPENSKPINPEIEDGSPADLWCIEKMAENDWSREQAEKMWFHLMNTIID